MLFANHGSAMPAIIPSILAYDHSDLLGGVRIAEKFGARSIHLDIMDGVFVPNISFGPQLVRDLRKHTALKLDVHLMVKYPEIFIERLINYGADSIAVHQEADCDISEIFSYIRTNNRECGLAINPGTVPNFELLFSANIALVMGVHPGFGGQKFLQETISTIKLLTDARSEHMFDIIVDGGITIELARKLIDLGVDGLVSGYSFFKSPEQFVQFF